MFRLAAWSMAAVLLAHPASAQSIVTGEIETDQPGAVIQAEVYGQFMEQLGSGISGGVWVGDDPAIPNTRGFRNDVVAALKTLEVPVVRWPGGCYADIYDWRDGIGPRGDRPVTLNRWWGNTPEDNAFGTHEFFDFAELIGARTYLSINMGSGTPREAAEWVEYITADGSSSLANERRANGRARPWKIDYLGLGNEPWGCGGRMRASFYADLMRQFVGFVDPGGDTQLVAAGPSADDYDWTRTLMRDADTYDQLSLHYYTLPTGDWTVKGSATGFDADAWTATFAQAYRIEEMIRRHDAVMDEVDPAGKTGLAVDEWGAWYDPTPGSASGHLQQQNSLRDALLAAVHFNIFHRHADRVRLSNVAQMVNVLQAMILTDGPRMTLTPTYHAFMLYKPFQGATVLPVALDGGSGRVGDLDVTAARGADGRTHVALVNVSTTSASRVSLSLKGAGSMRIDGRILTAPALDTHNTFDQPEAVRPAEYDGARAERDTLVVDVPAHALVVLSLTPPP